MNLITHAAPLACALFLAVRSHRLVSQLTVIVVLLLFSMNTASAQSSGGSSRANSNPFGKNRNYSARSPLGSRPAFSPYLNLLRSDNAVLNYHGLVRPEQEFRAANEQFQNQFGDVQKKFDTLEQKDASSNLGVTGHHVRFLSDQNGGAGSVQGTLAERAQRSDKLPPTPGSRIAPSGHGAYFTNHGAYFPFPNR